MTLALIVIIAALLGLYLWREHTYDRLTEEREKAWRLERTGLLQRIQAPERAVAEVNRPEREPVPHVPLEDDGAFAAVRERRNHGGDLRG